MVPETPLITLAQLVDRVPLPPPPAPRGRGGPRSAGSPVFAGIGDHAR